MLDQRTSRPINRLCLTIYNLDNLLLAPIYKRIPLRSMQSLRDIVMHVSAPINDILLQYALQDDLPYLGRLQSVGYQMIPWLRLQDETESSLRHFRSLLDSLFCPILCKGGEGSIAILNSRGEVSVFCSNHRLFAHYVPNLVAGRGSLPSTIS